MNYHSLINGALMNFKIVFVLIQCLSMCSVCVKSTEIPEHMKQLSKGLNPSENLLLTKNNCESYVYLNIGFISYKGCENTVSSESLGNGQTDKVSIYSFKAISYAEPPLGELRYQKPKPKEWATRVSVTIDATKFGEACMQPPIVLDSDPENAVVHSEDCLTLNIWSPTLDPSANLCVMVWVHGGSFLFGGSSFFDGTQLAIHGCVVLTMNYRLGSFGFLVGNTPDAPGNQGLWDQALALTWTQQNIQLFGGNPDNILLFGESSGSISVSNHVVSKVSNRYFRRALLESGTGMTTLFSRPIEFMRRVSKEFANSTFCPNVDNYVECLRQIPAQTIIAETLALVAAQMTQNNTADTNPELIPWYSQVLLAFVPIFGDEFMPYNLNESIRSGTVRPDIDIIIGHNEMEGQLFSQQFDRVRQLGNRYEAKQSIQMEALINKSLAKSDIIDIFINNSLFDSVVAEEYTKGFSDLSVPTHSEQDRLRSSAVHSLGDYILTCPTVLFGNQIIKNENFTGNIYQYKLTYAQQQSPVYGSDWAEATHFDECPLVYGFPFMDKNNYSDSERDLSSKIMTVWTNFAKNGTTEFDGHIWPKYTSIDGKTNLSYIELHTDSNRFFRVHSQAYEGNDGFCPNVIHNCKNFWEQILWQMF